MLVIWSLRHKGPGRNLGTAVGSVVMIMVIASLYGVINYGVKYWAQGDFEHASPVYIPQTDMTPMKMDKSGQLGMLQKGEVKVPASK